MKHLEPQRKTAIQFREVVAKWSEVSPDRPTLNGVSVSVRKGQLVAIVGRVGSGKVRGIGIFNSRNVLIILIYQSSILSCLLGELPASSGKVALSGTVSYASQEPWIFSGSIRQNIQFGLPYDAERYNAVIEACSLTHDFDLLEHGDRSLVDERGVILSGKGTIIEIMFS